ncbi:MAG: hypothetical protein AAFP19_19700 [Bacteroidota bacterium]
MDNKTIGLFVIGSILLIIVLAFAFSPKFRKDVIASEGEAAVLGLINVKGVLIVLLTAIFGGIFAYIIQLDAGIVPDAIDTGKALAHLVASEDDQYRIENQDGVFRIFCNGQSIGTVEQKTEGNIQLVKSKEHWNQWQVNKNEARIGVVNMRLNQEQVIYSEAQNRSFRKNRPYQIGDLDFYFIIDSIYRSYEGRKTRYNYDVRFGEGKQSDKVKWQASEEHYSKTANGRVYFNNGLRRYHSPDWEYNYYIGMGLGQPAFDSLSNTFTGVEKVNIIAVESKID